MRTISKTMHASLVTLAVLAPMAALAQPAVTAGKLSPLPVNINAPDPSPVIVLDITGAAATITVQYQSPSGFQGGESFFSNTSNGSGPGFTGQVVLKGYSAASYGNGSVLGPYAEPGTWTLTNISVCGFTGQCTQYNGASLAAIFPSLTFMVSNHNTPDVTPPTATSATVRTPVVSLGKNPTLQVNIVAQDNLSGVNNIQGLASNSTGTAGIGFSNPPPTRPLTSGVFALYSALQPSQPAGTYTIQYVAISDIAGNTTFISGEAAISKLFNGKFSFTVTQ